MNRILSLIALVLPVAPAVAADVALSLASTSNQTISCSPDGAGKLPVSGKLPRIRVDTTKTGFVDAAGGRFTPCGVSYYRPGTGWAPQLWKQFDAEATRKDFQRMKRMGMNVARVFVTFGSFYNQSGQLDPAGLAAFDRMLDLADETGIYLHPTGPENWEGLSPWAQSLGGVFDNFANEEVLKALEDYWRMFAARYRGRSTIWAYDFMSLHFYPLAKGVYRYEDQAGEDANLAVVEAMARECAKPGKPLVIGEFGWFGGGALDPGGRPASEEQQAQWCKRLVEVTSPIACGWINWGLHDTPNAGDVSRLTGLITVGGVDKAWGKAFGPLVKGQPAARAMPARPDLPWESCTMDGAAMTRFQAEYLAAFLARKP